MAAFPKQVKAAKLEFKVKQDKTGFEGLASMFRSYTDQPDSGDDRIHPGAFAKTIHEGMVVTPPAIKVLYQHDRMQPIGVPIKLEEMPNGLFIDAKISDTALGRDVLTLMNDGALSGLSIGYQVIKCSTTPKDSTRPADEWNNRIRDITEVKLFEISPCTFPMDEGASITAVKHMMGLGKVIDPKIDALLEMLSQAGVGLGRDEKAAKTTYPLGDRAAAWDSAAAQKRLKDKLGVTDKATPGYRACFFWWDPEAMDKLTGGKLPFCDVVDGKVTAMPKAIFACAAALSGSRGGVDLPEEDLTKVQKAIAAYYKRMAKEFEDDGIVAPWQKASNDDHETKVGKTISAATRQALLYAMEALESCEDAIDDAVEELQTLLDISDGPGQPEESTVGEGGKSGNPGDPALIQSIQELALKAGVTLH